MVLSIQFVSSNEKSPSDPPLLIGIGGSWVEVTFEVEESLVVILYIVIDELNGSEVALIPWRNLREKKKKKILLLFFTFYVQTDFCINIYT